MDPLASPLKKKMYTPLSLHVKVPDDLSNKSSPGLPPIPVDTLLGFYFCSEFDSLGSPPNEMPWLVYPFGFAGSPPKNTDPENSAVEAPKVLEVSVCFFSS